VEVHRAYIDAGANLVTAAMSTLAELAAGATGGYADSTDVVAREGERQERPRDERPEQTALDVEGSRRRYGAEPAASWLRSALSTSAGWYGF
jgi:hypothetical protein